MDSEVVFCSTEGKKQLQFGYDAFHQENFVSAIQHFGEVLEDNPSLAHALLGLAVSYFFMGDYQNASRYMDYCIENRPHGLSQELCEKFMDLCVGHCNIPIKLAATNNMD